MMVEIITPMDEGRMHCYPLLDLREHVIAPRIRCWCRPVEDEYGVIVHNALDQRERYETGELLPQ